MREDYHNKHSDYGLMEENLSALERCGKCQIIKMGERFRDPHSGLTGLLYVVVKRVDQDQEFVADSVPEEALLPAIVVDTVRAGLGDPGAGMAGGAGHAAGRGFGSGAAAATAAATAAAAAASGAAAGQQEYYELGDRVSALCCNHMCT